MEDYDLIKRLPPVEFAKFVNLKPGPRAEFLAKLRLQVAAEPPKPPEAKPEVKQEQPEPPQLKVAEPKVEPVNSLCDKEYYIASSTKRVEPESNIVYWVELRHRAIAAQRAMMNWPAEIRLDRSERW